MYYKLPIKERMDLMKSYKKANPGMSYRDMVNDYNDSYEKFKDGGYKSEAEYKTHLLDPYSAEKAKAQMDWNMNKMYYTQPKNDKESDKIITQKKMLASLKPRDFAAEKANYETQTRGANQMDGSGISSAELAYKYAKLIDSSGITSVTEIAKNAYNKDKQDPFDYLGLLRIPYVQQGMKELPKLTKQINKLSLINNIVTKSHDLEESYK